MARQSARTALVVALLVGSLVGAGATVALVGPAAPGAAAPQPADDEGDLTTLEQFDSRAAFERYVDRGRRLRGVAYRAEPARAGGDAAATPDAAREQSVTAATEDTVAKSPDRIGTTNVQVAALDEPDRVKTDGTAFYYAPGRAPIRHEPEAGEAPPKPVPMTHVIDASDPADPETVAAIDASGRLLQTGDRLVVIGDDALTGYDVSNPANPTEAWSRPLADRVVTARERNGTVYLVTRTAVDSPCPIEPVGPGAAVDCGEIYHPRAQIAVDATYSAFAIDAGDGDVRDSVSFVGTGRHSVVYMSTDALYVTYTKSTGRAALLADFLTEEFEPTPADVERRIAELRGYDLSPEATRIEVTRAVQAWLGGLPADERSRLQTALSERFRAYVAANQRDLTTTGVVRVDVDGTDLAVAETATVPGRPLNQFALSQHEGTLRITTTIPGAGSAESVADLYVLDADSLERRGSQQDMGEGQRVYAVRYVDETAYVVTFRRVDPLHVVDLSDPADPTEVGTLELPGFSNYLHPIDADHVLGVGEQDGRVKAVLFDVSDPTDPTVADAFRLGADWSAVSRTHHAFTIDRRHGVVFLPAGGTGAVLDYTNGSLSRTHTVRTDGPAERARYVNDYLYVFAGTELAVVDETDWTRETTLALDPA